MQALQAVRPSTSEVANHFIRFALSGCRKRARREQACQPAGIIRP